MSVREVEVYGPVYPSKIQLVKRQSGTSTVLAETQGIWGTNFTSQNW